MRNLHLVILMVLISLFSFLTGLAIIFWRYFEIAYVVLDDLSVSGTQIWDIHQLFLVLLLAIVFCLVLVIVLQKVFKKNLSNKGFIGLIISALILSIIFYPPKLEFQIRHYNNITDSTYINLTASSADFIDGNEDSFMGAITTKNTVQVYPIHVDGSADLSGESKIYECVEHQSYWFGHISIYQSFYPILDKINGDNKIKSRCKFLRNSTNEILGMIN